MIKVYLVRSRYVVHLVLGNEVPTVKTTQKKNFREKLDSPYAVRENHLKLLGEVVKQRIRTFPPVADFFGRRIGAPRPPRGWKPMPDQVEPFSRLVRGIAATFRISEADARAAILGQRAPKLRLVRVDNSLTGTPAGSFAASITMRVSITATPEEVTAAFVEARRRVLRLGDAQRVKPPEARTVELARFAARYEGADTPEGCARWNKRFPQWPAPPSLRTWRRDLKRATAQILSPGWCAAAEEAAFLGGLGTHRLDSET